LIFVSVISVMVFGALFTTLQYTLQLVAQSRSQLSALSLANERMEFFRSLPYNEVGTLTGIVRGPVANNQVLTLNGIEFTERIVIDYVDGPGDGIGGADTNGILQDYKLIKLEYTWLLNGQPYSKALVSNIMPRSVETGVGGGSIRINVYDQDFQPLPGARVQISNASSTAPLYELRLSDVNGQVLVSGVPVDSNYQITVGGPIAGTAYSTSSTNIADATLPNPSNPAFFVSEGGIASQTFIIDELTDVTINSYSVISEDSLLATFADATAVASSTDTTVASGELVLANTSGVYAPTGITYLSPITPSSLSTWETIRIAADLDVGTDYFVRLYTGDAVTGYTLIPDSELAGNNLGFTDSLIDISELDPIGYSAITVGITLITSNTNVTPEVDELEVFWRAGVTPRVGQSLTVRGDKILGTDTSGVPIFKNETTVTTNASGAAQLPDQEFDRYTITQPGVLDVATACGGTSFVHRAGEPSVIDIVYVAGAAETLRVMVTDSLGRSIPGASVQLTRAGYNVTQTTNTCGQTFFTGGVTAEPDYSLTVSVAGYTTQVVSPFDITGDAMLELILLP